MKKNIKFWLGLALVPFVMASCDSGNSDGDGDGSGDGSGSGDKPTGLADFSVYEPEDLEEFDLDYENPDKKLNFDWEVGDGISYEFVVSLNESLSDAVTVELSDTGEDKLTHTKLDEIMGELGVGEYKPATLYWAIDAKKDDKGARSEVRSMDLWRFIKPFTDPRDGEVYRVCKVVDPLTGEYAIWMADNMRATKYSDGTALDPIDDYRFHKDSEDADEHEKEWNRLRGALYSWTAVIGSDVEEAEEGEKVQGLAPNGWHIANKKDWEFLINSQDNTENPNVTLFHPDYWDWTSSKMEQEDITNRSKFNMVATGHVWYPVGNEDNNINESGTFTYFWLSSTPQEGDEFPWDPDPLDYPNQGLTYGFNNNDPGGALFPYDRRRGFSVRCVLD